MAATTCSFTSPRSSAPACAPSSRARRSASTLSWTRARARAPRTTSRRHKAGGREPRPPGLRLWPLTADVPASTIAAHREGRVSPAFLLIPALPAKKAGQRKDKDMDSAIAAAAVFKPKPSKAETKADITDHAARTIISAEVERREAKTARLRQARLEQEAAQAPVAAAPSRTPRTNKRKG